VNRETKRMMERRGRSTNDDSEFETDAFEIGDAGPAPREVRAVRERTTPMRFAREIREELRQVAWPSRAEMVNYSLVVFFTLVIMISLIFLLNFVFGKGVFFMFQK
jgi:preprotein translocase subunit SecE